MDQPSTHQSDEPATSERLLDDRACANCATNLRGASVFVDARTRLHIVTCPMCGERDALESYPFAPPLGAFVRPWASVLWLLVMLGLLAGGLSILGATAFDLTYDIVGEVDLRTDSVITQGLVAEGVDQSLAESDRQIRMEWAMREGAAGILDRMGPWRSWFPWWTLLSWTPVWVVFVLLGAIWSILLWGQPVHRRLIIMALIAVLAIMMFITALPALNQFEAAYYYRASQIVRPRLMWWIFPFMVLFLTTAQMIGVVIGRALARWYIRIMLPPSLRHGLRSLWTLDGRPFPSTASRAKLTKAPS